MIQLLIAILLALGVPVPPTMSTNSDTITILGDDDTGGESGHIPSVPPPPKPPQ